VPEHEAVPDREYWDLERPRGVHRGPIPVAHDEARHEPDQPSTVFHDSRRERTHHSAPWDVRSHRLDRELVGKHAERLTCSEGMYRNLPVQPLEHGSRPDGVPSPSAMNEISDVRHALRP
jgi:hypothetical protein